MNLIFSVLIVCSTLLSEKPSTEAMTHYHIRNTLSEISFGEASSESIYNSFESNEYASFFSELELTISKKNSEELVTQDFPKDSYVYVNKIEPTLKKLHSSIILFCKKYPSTKVASLLKTWSNFSFSKEEKETFSYFNNLKRKNSSKQTSLLEKELISILLQHDLMKNAFQIYGKNYPSFYLDNGDYLLDLYTHKKMLSLLDHNFEPYLFHHIETYLQLAKKKASFTNNTKLLHQMIQGDLALSSEAEVAAKNLLKPQLKKLDSYFSEMNISN